MLKIVAAGATALFVIASAFAYAQAPPPAGAGERLSAADVSTLTDTRINIVKAAYVVPHHPRPYYWLYWPWAGGYRAYGPYAGQGYAFYGRSWAHYRW
jgi:hypothetical protein